MNNSTEKKKKAKRSFRDASSILSFILPKTAKAINKRKEKTRSSIRKQSNY